MAIVLGPTLETERLILRPPQAGDFDAWAAFVADEPSMRHLGGVQPRSTAWRGFLSVVGAWPIQGFSMFSVIEKASGRWIGRLGPWYPEGWPGAEIVWSITRDATRQGYAVEGATAAIEWAFDRLGWKEVIHVIGPGNEPSKAVARKLGSAPRGTGSLPAPYEHSPVEVWGQTCAQWRARRGLSA
jgi:RimJ/RimL family protein N-acetyltransferase